MSMIIQAEHITKQYASHLALDDLSIEIPRGSVYGLLGPNGAGKTTLIRIINHITPPDSGRLLFDGRPMSEADVHRIGYLPEERGLYKKMKVGEQALYLARLKGLSRADAMTSLQRWFRRFEIMGWWDRKVEELSKGMAQKVQFIVTVIHNPELLIFDEPFSGFDPINTALLRDEILERAREGATVIFSTHNMSSVEEICDHITLINQSRNVLSGRVDHIRASLGTNTYRLSFRGSEEPLISSLAPLCEVSTIDQRGESNALLLTLPAPMPSRDILSIANEMVDIRGFEEQIPSMNDIFIRTVNSSSHE